MLRHICGISVHRGVGEVLSTLSRQTESLMDFYQAKEIRTMDGLTDSLLTKQFLMILSPELRQNVYSREPKSAEESAKYTDVYFKSTRMSNESADGHISRGALQHETPNGKNWRPRGSSVYPFNVRPQTAVPNQVRPCRETAGPREHSSSRVKIGRASCRERV